MRLHDIRVRDYVVCDPDAFRRTLEDAGIDIDREMSDTRLRNLYIVYPGTHMAELIASRDPFLRMRDVTL